MSDRKGDWQQMYTGRAVWPTDPRRDDVDIRDIAHALSQQCRFGGHTRWHYSVAQHSLLVLQLLEYDTFYDAYAVQVSAEDRSRERPGNDIVIQRTALLHDASEAYLVDIPRPLKVSLPDYKAYEEKWEEVLADAFGLEYPMPATIRFADNMVLALEREALFSAPPRPWAALPVPPIDIRALIKRRRMEEVEEEFLEVFYALEEDR
jgi:hypothetical protein